MGIILVSRESRPGPENDAIAGSRFLVRERDHILKAIARGHGRASPSFIDEGRMCQAESVELGITLQFVSLAHDSTTLLLLLAGYA